MGEPNQTRDATQYLIDRGFDEERIFQDATSRFAVAVKPGGTIVVSDGDVYQHVTCTKDDTEGFVKAIISATTFD